MAPLVPLPSALPSFLEPYLPPVDYGVKAELPFVTLTYAQSLDSRISIAPGVQTVISHLETKTMTHYIRSKHDAILVGISTVLADDPGLNCRYDSHKIVPVVVDPSFKFADKILESRLMKTVAEGEGLAPVMIVSNEVLIPSDFRIVLQEAGVTLLRLKLQEGKFSWFDILKALKRSQINSVMVEGGAQVINSLLSVRNSEGKSIINSLIVTIGPIYLGSNGVQVSPAEKVELHNISWWKGVQDSVLATSIK